jgi:gentisate 1,2-dioxygenase
MPPPNTIQFNNNADREIQYVNNNAQIRMVKGTDQYLPCAINQHMKAADLIDYAQEQTSTLLQHLMYNDVRPVTLYIDIDKDNETGSEDIDINIVLQQLRTEFNTDVIYYVKNDLKNKYHVFMPQIVYANINAMKHDLLHRELIKRYIDKVVYTKNRLLRLPYQQKYDSETRTAKRSSGIYNEFYEYDCIANKIT